MTTLHTFGCSITQGFALPDVVQPLTDDQGRVLPGYLASNMLESGEAQWEDIHVYAPSNHAWPAVLAAKLGVPVNNHARRGACFNQIARQCAANQGSIQPQDTVIVMWTYLSRVSLQWPARTAVPFCNMVDPGWGWTSRILPGFNKFFGLSRSSPRSQAQDQDHYTYIESRARLALDPRSVYDQYHQNLVTVVTVDGLLRSTGARVIHLSVEVQPYMEQLVQAQRELAINLREYSAIPDPCEWYAVSVDHASARIIHDPRIPPAENDMHPSVTHHSNFADLIYDRYFTADRCAASQP